MKKVFTKIAGLSVGLAMAIGVGVAVGGREAKVAKAADVLVYTLDGTVTGGSNGYATESDITQGDYSWKATGNTTMSPWRIGGSSITNQDRPIYSVDAISDDISKIEVSSGAASSITINSLTISVHSTADDAKNGSNAIASKVEETSSNIVSKTVTLEKTGTADWSGKYYRIVYNVTKSGSGNKFILFNYAKFYKASSAVLQSITLEKDDELVKTSYVDGDSVSMTGINAIGHFSDSTTSDVSSSCTITADRAKVATGETKITYSATYTPGGFTIADLDVSITVVDLAIEKVEKNGNYRLDFVQKQKFSYGTGKVKATWNNGTSKILNPTAEGVTAKIGTTDITGQTHYMTLDDDGKDLVMSYGGKSFTVGTVTVTPYVEPESGYWSPITNVSELEADMEVIIVASEHDFAMGKYTTGNNVTAIDTSKDEQGKISSSIPGVQVYTLKEGLVAGSFAFYDGEKYLAATGGTSSNYLKVEDEITNNGSFVISINSGVMSIVGQGSTASGAKTTMRYNNTDLVFSCYASTSSVGSLACLYKFTPESKSEDQIAVENFCKTSLHLDDSDPSYIDPNDNTSGTACKGETGYYALAKEAYDVLTDAQKEIFATSADVLIAQGRARLTAWAEANNETFDAVAGTFSVYTPSFALTSEDNNTMIIVISIAAISALAFTTLLVFKKKRQK